MMVRRTAAALCIALAAASSVLSGCDTLGSTKVANGQLYQSGDGRYDAYFNSVHQEQVASGHWPDDAKSSRKPIITALNLRPGASNSTILSATREKKGDASLGTAIEQTTAAELDRARRLKEIAAKLDEMQKHGEELKKQTVEDKKNLGADKADEKKSAKKDEVKREMTAAVDAVESMADDARKGAKEAEDLAAKLKAAWTGKADDDHSASKSEEKKEEKKKPEPVAKKNQPKPEAPPAGKKPKPEPSSEDKPAPAKSQPTQKAPDEVFNP